MENPMFQKLIAKKKSEGKEISPVHKDAKSSVLEDLMGQLGGMNVDKINGMKKVSVASDSKSGLTHGLDKAKEMLAGHDDKSSEEADDESSEQPELESSEEQDEEDKSMEDMQKEIEELKAQIASMKA